jgi:hypothetical protein
MERSLIWIANESDGTPGARPNLFMHSWQTSFGHECTNIAVEFAESVIAIKEGMESFEKGEGRLASEALAELAKRVQIAKYEIN